MYSIGLDISKASISVFIPINSLNIVIDNNITALKALYSKLKKLYKKDLNKLIFVYEPTGSYSFLTKKFCALKSIKSFIINPKQSSNFAKAIGHRSKSHRIDALMLSRAITIARENEIRIPVIDETLETIKELMSYYKFTVKQRVALSNHQEALKCKDGNKYTLRDIQKRIKSFREKESEILDKIKEIIESDSKLSTTYKNIQTIPGIGKIAGIVLMHLFISYPNANENQIDSLTGLDPIIKESGTSLKTKARISKAGIKLYRGSLFMATMVAIKFNEQMKDFYNRLKDNGKHSTVAQIAVMRKLIVIAHALYKNNCTYNVDIYNKAIGKFIDKSAKINTVA